MSNENILKKKKFNHLNNIKNINNTSLKKHYLNRKKFFQKKNYLLNLLKTRKPKKNKYFYLNKKNLGFFILNTSKHNLMFTLCNFKFKPIRVGSIGIIGKNLSKRDKLSDYTVGLLVNFILKWAYLKGLRYLILILKISKNYIMYKTFNVIKDLNLKIIQINNLYNLPHNGVRHAKKRRV